MLGYYGGGGGLVVSDSLQLHRLQSARLLCPWDFPGKESGVGCHFLLQGIFQDQTTSPALQADSVSLIHQQSPSYLIIVSKFGSRFSDRGESCFKSLHWWSLLTAALGNLYTSFKPVKLSFSQKGHSHILLRKYTVSSL